MDESPMRSRDFPKDIPKGIRGTWLGKGSKAGQQRIILLTDAHRSETRRLLSVHYFWNPGLPGTACRTRPGGKGV